MSLVVAEPDLNDPDDGILANPLERGRNWERTGQVSYFEDGELVLSSRVGVRLHGGDARRANRREQMFRLYFRDRYRVDPNRPLVLHTPDGEPARRWIIRLPPHENFYSNVFALEIARQNGALTPQFKPVRFYLNGEYRSNYLLIEQINREGWGRSYFGHDDYLLYVYRDAGAPHQESLSAYQDLQRWAHDPEVDMTLEEASRRIDVDNFARHLMTFAFAGESDPYQGAAFRDVTEPDSKWTWLHYDLDHSFAKDATAPPVVDVRKPAFRLFTGASTGERGNDVRAVLFNRLILDPEFLDYFGDLMLRLLNHHIDRRFLTELLDRYAYTSDPPGSFSGVNMARFMRRRPAFIVRDLQTTLGIGPIHSVTLDLGGSGMMLVDGYEKHDQYRGWYRDRQKITVELNSGRDLFSHWLVNGKVVEMPRLELPITGETTIKPVFTR